MNSRDPRYDILFEPVRIGPVTSKNRFYQTPHALGIGPHRYQDMVAFRQARAEGGWGVVCVEETMIHPTSGHDPFQGPHLWSDADITRVAPMAEAVHKFGALAGVELAHVGSSGPCWEHRGYPLSPTAGPVRLHHNPISTRQMDRRDIAQFRRWYVDAALRAKKADFDIVYVYCAHDLSLLQDFLVSRTNKRTDDYGGSFQNRLRLLREVLSDVKDAVGDRCAVAVRLAVEERRWQSSLNTREDGRRVIEELAEVPDLWDVNVSDWAWDSGSSRFFEEGQQEPFISFVKQVTSKPVVGVGRFTSPDAMVSQIKRGILDFIGAARPSIADPFLPNKIDTGQHDDIRECIGCNVCAAEVMNKTTIRCTQNPTAGEEARLQWHPERVPAAAHPTRSVLVVGGGPAGLQAALTLGKRGYQVSIAEAGESWGGRIARERNLPRLATWGRVVDHRLALLQRMPNVEMYLSSRLSADDVLGMAPDHVIVATGSSWRRDGTGRSHDEPIPGAQAAHVFTPDDIMAGKPVTGKIVVYDDDYYYMASALAEKLAREGNQVTYVTTASDPAPWTFNTLELGHVVKALLAAGVEIVTGAAITAVEPGSVKAQRVLTEHSFALEADAVVLVTCQTADETLYRELQERIGEGGPMSLDRSGDCVAPAFIAQAVRDGHRAGMSYDLPEDEGTPTY
ncbi:FAD-dependent oxidoreductase [Massilia sp. CT11-137]|uniref:oxidoreductase n=1 Tax=Massilia sp. CT11-137 TaxID=3393901 RepID=UPI0039B0010F